MEQEHKIQNIQIPSSLGYVDLLIKSGERFLGALKECKDCGLTSSWNTLQAHAKFTWMEILCMVVCALALTGLRRATTKWIFQPFSKWCRLRPKEAEKVPESAWKFLFYCASWFYCSYLLFFTKHNFFHDPPSTFRGWTSGADVPLEIALLYLVQGSFYAHSTYATLYLDAWRKDSVVMILHHLVTFNLIIFSYAFRYHNIGILVLFHHDVNDIVLEFSKLNVYFKTRGETYHRVNSIITEIGSVLFSVSWFWFRLYWFPMKVLYVTCCSSLESNPDIPFYFFFNVLLFALTLMNIYWFLYIVMFVMKVVTGQVKEVNDVREYDISENQKAEVSNAFKDFSHKNTSDSKHSLVNGFVKNKRV
ncbi:PREDICTED: ceramide synthase 1 isoform X2 [Nanorana parkeri]|uniref:ceramide synthase 1 isoform X1 n=1 Tax=Nanorana parkeri TaxID=125878 RepID=UPI00085450F0|nr:PREDICTED: ceramide synthase 1 isoform X1 [Nanorana parkeri]XP_018423581.1 PREDICTED: ceramide synthase 1 isoform X2 [Nanorana parkeri]